MTTLRRIDIGSAFKVGIVISALSAAIFGLIGLVAQVAFASLFFSAFTFADSTGGGEVMAALSAFSLVTLCIFWIIGIVVAAIFGGIASAISAALYNLTANWVGGLQFELHSGAGLDDEIEWELRRAEKAKRG